MKICERSYLRQLISYIRTPDIKVITGVRRSGKSSLLELFLNYLKSTMADANIIYIDFSNLEYEDLLEYHKLHQYVLSKYQEEMHNFVIIDEVQLCENFEKAINSLHSMKKFDIYLTGSNAFLLSSDLATLFTGRTIEIKIFPFSYQEFLDYYELNDPIAHFDDYLEEGGFAGGYLYLTYQGKMNYVLSVYETIIERDLIKHKKIRNPYLLKKITAYLIDNISNLSSLKNISHTLNDETMAVNDKTVSSYIDNLCQSFLFYKVSRYDIRGKKYLSSSEKYYLVDHSIKYALTGRKDMNYGRIYENMVAIELLRRGYEIYVGMLYQKEIDFVAINRDEKIYIQVADDISNEETLKRELFPLLKIKDGYSKLLICRTKHPEYMIEGIKIIDIGLWLSDLKK